MRIEDGVIEIHTARLSEAVDLMALLGQPNEGRFVHCTEARSQVGCFQMKLQVSETPQGMQQREVAMNLADQLKLGQVMTLPRGWDVRFPDEELDQPTIVE